MNHIYHKLTKLVVLTWLLSSCAKTTTDHPHQMYIWQQVWTTELVQSIQFWQGDLAGVRVLSGVYNADLKQKVINANWESLPGDVSITQVYRINGAQLPDIAELLELIKQQTQLAENNNISTATIEIDFDSPTSKLPQYKSWLSGLKTELGSKLQLSFTALPTWGSSNHLKALLSAVDHYVLQIHSADSPDKGLVNFSSVEKSIKLFNSTYDKPFLISLPNYWYQAATDKNNNIKAILAEGQSIDATHSQQIFAEPRKIHELILQIEKSKPNNFIGWVWFRMPTNKDKQIFSNSTLKKLIKDKTTWQLKPVQLKLQPIGNSSAATNFDVFIENTETVEQSISIELNIPEGCEMKHLIDGFNANNGELIKSIPRLYKPNQSIRIGWAECRK